jgi:hypothetical protein
MCAYTLAPVIPTRLVCFDEAGGAAEINWREFRINRGEIGREEESRERAGRGERGDAPREARPYRRRRKVPNGMEVKRKLPGVWLLRWPARSSVAAAVTCTATGRPCGASASSTRRISASVSDHSATHACEPTSLLNQLPHSAPRSGLVDTHNIRSTGDDARSGTLRCAARRADAQGWEEGRALTPSGAPASTTGVLRVSSQWSSAAHVSPVNVGTSPSAPQLSPFITSLGGGWGAWCTLCCVRCQQGSLSLFFGETRDTNDTNQVRPSQFRKERETPSNFNQGGACRVWGR